MLWHECSCGTKIPMLKFELHEDIRKWTFRRCLGHKEWALINEIKVFKKSPETASLPNSLCVCMCVCVCSVTKSCLTLCDPMDWSMPGFPVLHCFLEFAQIHVHWVGDARQPPRPLSSPSPSAFSNSQWVVSSHQSFTLELQLEYQFFQWIFGVNFF